MNVLSLNPGSNTLKYRLIATQDESCLASQLFDHIRDDDAVAAARQILQDCRSPGIDAIGVRVVHGGPQYSRTVAVTDQLLDDLQALTSLAPLHLPTDLAVMRAMRQQAPELPVFAVFDTAFHRTLPATARSYPLPQELSQRFPRFGFHGLAHQYVTQEWSRRAPDSQRCFRLISVHLGGGASACAVRDGRSVDTTMGYTPLEGLMMSTRCGDLDPGVVLQLIREGQSADDVEELLNRRSGLLGLSGISGDIRDLEPAASSGNRDAELALSVYAHRFRRSVGAMLAVLDGCDAVVLSGALAENSPTFRERLLTGLGGIGFEFDASRNQAASDPEVAACLSPAGVSPELWIIPADEELQIARDVAAANSEQHDT